MGGWVVRLDDEQIEVLSDEMAAILRQKTGAERLSIANGMFVSARQMITSALREAHPDWSDQQVTREVARRLSHGAI